MFLLLVLGSTTAQAGQIRADHFFDIQYAKSLWHDFRSYNEIVAYDKEQCPAGGEYEVWLASYRANSQQALKTLEEHTEAGVIKRCSDLALTSEIWNEMYHQWRNGRAVYGGVGWNDCKGGPLSMINVITGKCDDMPDWRHPNNVKQDEANTAQGNRIREGILGTKSKKP